MANTYRIDIQMSPDTVSQLQLSGSTLYAFKAVRTGISGYPLVWYASTSFQPVTTLSWGGSLQAYVTRGNIQEGREVEPIAVVDIAPGMLWKVEANGHGQVIPGFDDVIAIQTKSTLLAAGIGEPFPDSPGLECVFALSGLATIRPAPAVLLMIASDRVEPGTSTRFAFAPSVFIDLTDANMRTVSFDVERGWDAGGASWARKYPKGHDLLRLLMEDEPLAASSR